MDTGLQDAATTSRFLIQKGRAHLAKQRTADAHAAFCIALNVVPHSTEAQSLAALTWMLLGAPHLAMHHAQIALAADPSNADAILALAGASQRIGDKAVFDPAMSRLAAVQGAQTFHQLLGLSAALDDGDFEVALVQLAELIEENPDDAHRKDLFMSGFRKFLATGARCEDFIDGVGLKLPPDDPSPSNAGATPEPASIDIIIPVFNAVDDLATCLSSIDRWWSRAIGKIILVDDVSDQTTAAWLDDRAKTSDRMVVVHRAENGGFTASVISGLDHSQAPYAVLLNSDTIVTPGWIDRLWRALTRRKTTALAGPVSNNAYFQTIMPHDPPATAEAASDLDDENEIERIAALTLVHSRKVTPRVPLLSGFCLMLRRDLYDLAGGLDVESFPRGYWEMQDLCLRLMELGHDSVLADDVYVHHGGKKSVDDGRRKNLIRQGRQRMNEKHTALRVMTAESLAAMEPEIQHHWDSLLSFQKKSATRVGSGIPPEPLVHGQTRRAVKMVKEWGTDIAEDEVCLFVTHAPFGQVSDYTLHYLQSLRDAGLRIMICPIVQDLDVPLQGAMLDTADAVLPRLNGGFDFAAWADMLLVCPQLWNARRLYFVNDSIVGPFRPLHPVIDRIRQKDAGFFALSESSNPSYHAQSFFFGWNRPNLVSAELQAFWRDVAVYSDKTRIIFEYELNIASLSTLLPDTSQDVVFGMKELFGSMPEDLSYINATHYAWRHMLVSGFPFVKTDLLREHYGATGIKDSWETVCKTYGADIASVHRHIERSRFYRSPLGRGPSAKDLMAEMRKA